MEAHVSVSLNEFVFIKNPESSDLGKKIIFSSIELIENLGFESFTFKKLANQIDSTEASIYRYFENKNQLLVYLTSWYWERINYQLILCTNDIDSAEERLTNSICVLTQPMNFKSDFHYINEQKLYRIIITESSKVYLTKDVATNNISGYYLPYRKVVDRVSNILLEINPGYKYPHMLVSTTIEGAHHQRYFAEYLPRLTDVINGEDSVTKFYTEMVHRTIEI